MTDCEHFVGFSTVPDAEGLVRQNRVASGEFAADTRELFAVADSYLKPEAKRRPDENPQMSDDEIIGRYLHKFNYCPNCGERLLNG
ncbi:hypothetical protein [Noviherbaspirillum malthae]|uniref:hypothetical protein n=1 Tax=Noviherbaspirillum malthae TaxID=1260987 RepID=UPI0018900716|nr:hypothetical protein [Noviherbaspirillum malthae]